jgi:hypothetical protein
MTLLIKTRRPWFSQHWFVPLALVIVLGDLSASYWLEWSDDFSLLEAALIFDFVFLLPLLYWWCYRRNGKTAVLKAIALACLGIWATGWLIPDDQKILLEPLGWARHAALGFLIALEVWLCITVYRAVIMSELSSGDAESKLRSEGLPSWLAKFIAFEASLFKQALIFVRRVVGTKK